MATGLGKETDGKADTKSTLVYPSSPVMPQALARSTVFFYLAVLREILGEKASLALTAY